MISFSNINKQYGKQLLFVDASFQLNPGEKVGLVGPNGAGKTTLFRMVVGEETPDEGAVSVPKKLTIGYFRQDVEEMQGRSVLDEAIAGSGRVGLCHHLRRFYPIPQRRLTCHDKKVGTQTNGCWTKP
jgi:ATPase subunit of ABC transporter with duplicated ATPase domains